MKHPLRSSIVAVTLMELLLSIAVIAIVVAFLAPAVSSLRFRNKEVRCLSNLRQIGVALHGYLADHELTFPHPSRMNEWAAGGAAGETLYRNLTPEQRPLNHYLNGNFQVFRSPLDVGERNRTAPTFQGSFYQRTGSSYLYNSRINVTTIPLHRGRAYTLCMRVEPFGADNETLRPIRLPMVREPSRTLALATPDIRGATEEGGTVWWHDRPGSDPLHAHALFVDGHARKVRVGSGFDGSGDYRFYAGPD